MKPKVFVTRGVISQFAPDEFKELETECEVEVFPHRRTIQKDELLKAVKGKDGILYCIGDPFFDEDIFEAGKGLKIIASVGVGFSHIDIDAATSRGILVANTYSDLIALSVAEATWMMILAITKRIVEGDRDVRDGKFTGWGIADYIGADILEKTLGIIGLGRIGKKVARVSRGWDLRILYNDIIAADPATEKELKVERVSLEALLKESDFITLHVPLTKGGEHPTYHLIGEKELSLMKPSAYIVNTCRGPVIDEKVLVRFLREKRIAGAALDVYENEPVLAPGLTDLVNVVLAPHSASATPKARRSYAALAIENLLAGLRGETPPNLVNVGLIKK
jgi:glyoxylate reductase